MSVERVLLIERDGLFWAPEESPGTTTPGWVKDPSLAKRIVPWDWVNIRLDPCYYCESSDRMRRWLAGSQILLAEVTTTVEFL